MFTKTARFAPIFAFVLFAGGLSATAEDPETCFTLASLKGSFAIVGTYGANEARALARFDVDGDGNLAGKFLVNEPTPGSTAGARTIVEGTLTGTLTVSCDGTGVTKRVLTVGTKQTIQMDDFLITGAKVKDGHLVVTAIVDAQRTPSAIVAGGVFLTRVWTRLPNDTEE